MSPQTSWRLLKYFNALLSRESTPLNVETIGLAHILIGLAKSNLENNWEVVASVHREAHGVPVGTGYGKEQE